jgi:hypothetical protein
MTDLNFALGPLTIVGIAIAYFLSRIPPAIERLSKAVESKSGSREP